MSIKLPFELTKSVAGEASISMPTPINDVFNFIGEGFFVNYPKWAVEVVEFEPLAGLEVFIGAAAKQVRHDNGENITTLFKITEYEPVHKLVFAGIDAPYKQSYLLEANEIGGTTTLTFRFELLELEVFMRPFEKLIRYAIEEGAENTVANISNLLSPEAVTAPVPALI